MFHLGFPFISIYLVHVNRFPCSNVLLVKLKYSDVVMDFALTCTADGASIRFYIAVTCGCGASGEPPSDVALELCVRFRDRQVVRRACVSGLWGDAEQDVPFFPFIKDQPFKVTRGLCVAPRWPAAAPDRHV